MTLHACGKNSRFLKNSQKREGQGQLGDPYSQALAAVFMGAIVSMRGFLCPVSECFSLELLTGESDWLSLRKSTLLTIRHDDHSLHECSFQGGTEEVNLKPPSVWTGARETVSNHSQCPVG